jgi:hypothetical protein
MEHGPEPEGSTGDDAARQDVEEEAEGVSEWLTSRRCSTNVSSRKACSHRQQAYAPDRPGPAQECHEEHEDDQEFQDKE